MKTSTKFAFDWPRALQLIAGLFAAVLGVGVMAGWHTGNQTLMTFGPSLAPMVYNAAVSFVLCGIALLLEAVGLRRVALAVGLILMIIGALTATEYASGADLRIDRLLMDYYLDFPLPHPGRMALSTAICFICLGLTFLLRFSLAGGRFAISRIILTTVVAVMATAALMGYLLNVPAAYSWGAFSLMAAHTAFGFLIVTVGIFSQNWDDLKSFTRVSTRRLPIVVGLGIFALTVNLYLALSTQQQTNIDQAINADAAKLKFAVENGVRERMLGIERMAERWTKRGGTPFAEWQADAENYRRDFQSYQAIEWVDPEFKVRWIEPFAGNETAIGFDLASNDVRRSAFEMAMRERRTIVSQSVRLKQGGTGILFFAPVYNGGHFDGFVVGVSRIDTLLQAILPDDLKNGYAISVVERGENIFGAETNDDLHVSAPSELRDINLAGLEWQTSMTGRPKTIGVLDARTPEAVLFGGTLFAILLSWTIYLLHRSRREIVERVRVQKRLSKSEKFSHDLIEKSLGFISRHDLDGRILSVNPAGANALGYEPGEVVGRSFSDFMPEGKKRLMTPYFEQVCREGEMTTQVPLLTKNGEARIWNCSDVLYGEPGGKQYILGYAQDITDFKQTQKQLETSERLYRNLIDKSLGLICTHDPDGIILSVNPSGADALGYTQDDMVGTPLSDYVPSRIRLLFALYLDKIKAEGEASGFMQLVTSSGEEKIWQYNNVLLGDDGKSPYVLGYAQDFTEHKRMESELKLVRDAALESARMKSEFLANMSHEIRTPMNGVMGMTELLLETQLDEFQRSSAETIRNSADALLAIINDILDFSKIEAGKLSFETIDFDLRNTVESTVELFAEQAAEKRVELASLVNSDVPVAVQGDPGRLRQILTNLIGNAVKFTERGEIVVQIEKETESTDDVRLKFSIRDTGIGIAPDAQKYLFQAFTQADGSTTRKFGGTGLGLAISKNLVEMMGGEIDLASEPGQGSVFSFTADFKKQPFVRLQKPVPRTDLSNVRVLIVDDNSTNRKILRHQTQSWGMIADVASSGAYALEMIDRASTNGKPYDLVILDLMMPEMDGFELARRIRVDASLAALRLILMPSHGQRGHGRAARQAGIAGYLIKPVKQTELFDCIAAVMGDTSPAETSHQKQTSLVTRYSLGERRSPPRGHILIAEDNPVNQVVAKLHLERLGFTSDTVANGRLAIAALERNQYSLVLMDCQMPEMDGYAATGEIRRVEQNGKHIPIIAVTANALEGARERCLAAGMDDYLTKPFKQEQLRAVIERFLSPEATAEPSRSVGFDIFDKMPPSEKVVSRDVLISGVTERLAELEPDLGEEMVVMIIDLFKEDAVLRLEGMRAAFKQGNYHELEKQAHSLKGASSNIGANHLAELCEQIETQSEGEKIEESEDIFRKLEISFTMLLEILDEVYKERIISKVLVI